MLPLSTTTSHDSVGILVGICLLSSRSWRNKTLHPAHWREALADIGELRIAGAYFLLDLKNGMHFSVPFSQTRRQLAWRQRRRMRTSGKTRLLSVLQFSGWGLRRPPRDVSRKTCITPRPINEKWHETKKKCNRTCVWQYSAALGFGDLISRPPNKIGCFFGYRWTVHLFS
jgi:hypothetical protein